MVKESGMKKTVIFLIATLIICCLSLTACHNDTGQTVNTETYLHYAQPYFVVDEYTWMTENPERSIAHWYIISKDASGFEEFAQTAAQAVLDLYDRYKADYSLVTLLPLAGIYISYAKASFAADGRGEEGMIGAGHEDDSY